MRKLSGAIALVLAGVAAPALAEADQSFQGAGEQTTLDCDGGSIEIEGASNELVITGGCTSVTVNGAGNHIQVAMAPGGRIAVEGASNRIRWSAPAGKKALIRSVGADNQFARIN